MTNTPILFLVFNRPDCTRKVFESIREAKPKQLFIVADGPRAEAKGEDALCKEVRKIVSNIDWDCELKTLFREENLGCGIGVANGISWFFENVDAGIILEDDCLPDKSFYSFCEQLLIYYKDDSRIMHISGNNFQFGAKYGNESYYFSKYSHNWGWATWKRAWDKYQFELADVDEIFTKPPFSSYKLRKKEKKYWTTIFSDLKFGKTDVWDGQWLYCVWKNKGISILPNVNLVKNIGFNEKATHTHSSESILSNIETLSIAKMIHPSKIEINNLADKRSFDLIYSYELNFVKRIKNKLMVLFNLGRN